jgi:erythromycin esterase
MRILLRFFVLKVFVFAVAAQLASAQQASPSPAVQTESQKAENKRKQQTVIQWFKEKAIPIKTVEAGNGFADLQPLKRVFKDVRFVGLGEETHGTREFFQFKHRMLEFLVKEMGFRVFAIEASFAACENINDYVTGKSNDGAAALDSQKFWVWNTEEVRAMMDWMREYNRGVPAEKRVKFVGFDIQHNEIGKAKLLEYLKRVASPDRVRATEELFKTNLDEFNAALDTRDKQKQAEAKLAEFQSKYNDLFVFLEINEATLTAASSRVEYEQMRETARVLAQYIESYKYNDFRSVVLRDLYMADNFRRLVSREPKDTRFVIWAHNSHIASGGFDGEYQTFGYHLRSFYAKDYYALGFCFDQGSFQAREGRPKDPVKRMLVSFTVKSAPEGTLDWYLAQTDHKIFLMDFRTAAKNTVISEWLAAPREMRTIGSVFDPNSDERNYFGPLVVDKEFDGLFFIKETTRARPNPTVKDVAQAP